MVHLRLSAMWSTGWELLFFIYKGLLQRTQCHCPFFFGRWVGRYLGLLWALVEGQVSSSYLCVWSYLTSGNSDCTGSILILFIPVPKSYGVDNCSLMWEQTEAHIGSYKSKYVTICQTCVFILFSCLLLCSLSVNWEWLRVRLAVSTQDWLADGRQIVFVSLQKEKDDEPEW